MSKQRYGAKAEQKEEYSTDSIIKSVVDRLHAKVPSDFVLKIKPYNYMH